MHAVVITAAIRQTVFLVIASNIGKSRRHHGRSESFRGEEVMRMPALRGRSGVSDRAERDDAALNGGRYFRSSR